MVLCHDGVVSCGTLSSGVVAFGRRTCRPKEGFVFRKFYILFKSLTVLICICVDITNYATLKSNK